MSKKLNQKLQELVQENLIEHQIWQGDFFNKLQAQDNPEKTWEMLTCWTENMIRASYGFQTYVLILASRASDEKIRRLLVENEWEELGDYEYPKRSHFQMVCKLAALCGVEEKYIKQPRLLETSKRHIETHIKRCEDAPFLYGLGMIFLIENLTRLEFQLVLRGFIRFWYEGTGKSLEEFALNGGIEYFTSNIEADDGHAEDVAEMIEQVLISMGVDIEDEKKMAPYIHEISEGMKESIKLRNGFLQGVHNKVYAEEKILEVA
jgi:pyrroloquinoline quinone (PQQ) biosynthesis protein C